MDDILYLLINEYSCYEFMLADKFLTTLVIGAIKSSNIQTCAMTLKYHELMSKDKVIITGDDISKMNSKMLRVLTVTPSKYSFCEVYDKELARKSLTFFMSGPDKYYLLYKYDIAKRAAVLGDFEIINQLMKNDSGKLVLEGVLDSAPLGEVIAVWAIKKFHKIIIEHRLFPRTYQQFVAAFNIGFKFTFDYNANGYVGILHLAKDKVSLKNFQSWRDKMGRKIVS